MTSKIHPTAFIHPLADVEPGCTIGKNSKIWRWTHVMSGAVIGDDVSIGQSCFVAGTVKIGNGVKIQNHVSIYEGVTLEDGVFCGPSVVFTNVKFPRSHRKGKFEKTLVKKGSAIGANATIVCGIVIGEWAMVAASACVTRDVPPGVTVMGVPAVQKRNKNHHLEKLNI